MRNVIDNAELKVTLVFPSTITADKKSLARERKLLLEAAVINLVKQANNDMNEIVYGNADTFNEVTVERTVKEKPLFRIPSFKEYVEMLKSKASSAKVDNNGFGCSCEICTALYNIYKDKQTDDDIKYIVVNPIRSYETLDAFVDIGKITADEHTAILLKIFNLIGELRRKLYGK